MRTRSAGRLPHTPSWFPALAAAVGFAAGAYGFRLGGDWRGTLSLNPLDSVAPAGLLMIAISGGLGILLGLVLTLTRRGTVGPLVYACGVGLVCGVMLGFLIGPG